MKKIILFILLLLVGNFAQGSELTEDYFDIARSYCVTGQYRQAISYLDKILRIEPYNKEVHSLKKGLQTLISGNKNSYITTHNKQLMQAVDYKLDGDEQNQVATLKSESEKGNYWASYFLGEHYFEKNNFQDAIVYYEKAIKQNSNFSLCNLKIANCYAELNKYFQANNYLNQYLIYNPEDDFAYALRAKINFNEGNFSDAENDIITAIALNEDITYRYLYGKILYERRNYRESKKILTTLTNEFKNAEIYKYIGLCEYRLGDYNNALLNLDKAIILSNDDISLNNLYNEVKYMLEQQK